jgi:hypothetical protein
MLHYAFSSHSVSTPYAVLFTGILPPQGAYLVLIWRALLRLRSVSSVPLLDEFGGRDLENQLTDLVVAWGSGSASVSGDNG